MKPTNQNVTAIPTYKKGPKNYSENYRAVSITSILCKLMESIVRDKLVCHMMENKLFSEKQHGFVRSRNCVTNLLICIEIWTEMMEKGHLMDIIYTDFAKAFDRVPHQRLSQKIRNNGIIGQTLQWIKAFLTGRSQRVRVEQGYSSWNQVKSGIPQGSVLGPILFVIFINDMPGVVESFCQLFADDAKVFRNICSSEDNKKLQCDIDKLSDWAEKWQLHFNTDKCKSLHIGRTNKRQVYQMNGISLAQIKEEKDLGVIIDHELRFHQRSAASVKKANRVLGTIKKSFSHLDETTLPLLYKTLARPHLEANVVWGRILRETSNWFKRFSEELPSWSKNTRHCPMKIGFAHWNCLLLSIGEDAGNLYIQTNEWKNKYL